MINFESPFEDLFKAAETVSGKEIHCSVSFADIEDGLGFTLFPDDISEPIVQIHFDQTIPQLLDIMAHELAHVICGSSEEHGSDWEKTYEQINEVYNRMVMERYEM